MKQEINEKPTTPTVAIDSSEFETVKQEN